MLGESDKLDGSCGRGRMSKADSKRTELDHTGEMLEISID